MYINIKFISMRFRNRYQLGLCHFVINEFEPIKYLYEIRITIMNDIHNIPMGE
jgi:hypothetical protein